MLTAAASIRDPGLPMLSGRWRGHPMLGRPRRISWRAGGHPGDGPATASKRDVFGPGRRPRVRPGSSRLLRDRAWDLLLRDA